MSDDGCGFGRAGCVLSSGSFVAYAMGLDGVLECVCSTCCVWCDVVAGEGEGAGLSDEPPGALPAGLGVCFSLGAVVDGSEGSVAKRTGEVVGAAVAADGGRDLLPLGCAGAGHGVTSGWAGW